MLLVGLPASGKSTFYRERFAATHTLVSKDAMRRGSNKVKRQCREILGALSEGHSVVVDNTNVSCGERAEVIVIAKELGAKVVVYWFAESVADCRERNASREGAESVPLVAIYAAAKRYEEPSPEEGIDEIHIVRLQAGRFVVDDIDFLPSGRHNPAVCWER